MTAVKKTVLVLGATGRQGGATVRHLLAQGWGVRAFTRDTNQAAVQALQQAGAEVVQGDNEDRASLETAMQGVYGVFSIQAYRGNEVQQGKNIADTAKAAGIQHFIYTSVQNAEDLARVGGEANKWEIEQYIWALGLPATILRPAFFMETLITPRTDVPSDTSPDPSLSLSSQM
ncbi:MAG: NmrA family NAD(P)-binding protein [Chloroflexota bacterium]